MKTTIRLKIGLVIGASLLATTAAVLGLSLLIRQSTNTSKEVVALTRAQAESALTLAEQAAKFQDFTLRLVRARDLDAIESLVAEGEAAAVLLETHARTAARAEQARGSATILNAVEQMRSLAAQVRRATKMPPGRARGWRKASWRKPPGSARRPARPSKLPRGCDGSWMASVRFRGASGKHSRSSEPSRRVPA